MVKPRRRRLLGLGGNAGSAVPSSIWGNRPDSRVPTLRRTAGLFGFTRLQAESIAGFWCFERVL
jgi:hypothetical protein